MQQLERVEGRGSFASSEITSSLKEQSAYKGRHKKSPRGFCRSFEKVALEGLILEHRGVTFFFNYIFNT